LGKAQAFGGLAWPGFPSQLTAMPRSGGRSALAPKPPALPQWASQPAVAPGLRRPARRRV